MIKTYDKQQYIEIVENERRRKNGYFFVRRESLSFVTIPVSGVILIAKECQKWKVYSGLFSG